MEYKQKIEDYQNRRQPNWKPTKMEDNLNGIQSKRNITIIEGN